MPIALRLVRVSIFRKMEITVAMHGMLGWKMENMVGDIYFKASIAPTTLTKLQRPKVEEIVASIDQHTVK